MTDIDAIRAKARAHQTEIDASIVYLTPQHLAARWSVAVSTVYGISRDELPYKEMGRGTIKRRRRYHPDDVAAYEARDRHARSSAA